MSTIQHAGVDELRLIYFRLHSLPGAPGTGGRDGYVYFADVYGHPLERPVALELHVSHSTRVQVSVNDETFHMLVERAINEILRERLDRHGDPPLDQIRGWAQPIVIPA